MGSIQFVPKRAKRFHGPGSVMAAVCVAGLAWMSPPATAGESDSLDASQFGYVNQHTLDGNLGAEACLPSTIVNHFVHLENQHTELAQGLITGGSSYRNWKDTALQVLHDMQGAAAAEALPGSGGYDPDFPHHFDTVHQRVTQAAQQRGLQASFDARSTSSSGFDRPGVSHGAVTKEYLQRFLRQGHAGQLGMSPLSGGAGHAVLLVGMDDHQLHFIDPEDPSAHYTLDHMEPRHPARPLPASYQVAPSGGHVFHSITHSVGLVDDQGRPVIQHAHVDAGQIYFAYRGWNLGLPYNGYARACKRQQGHVCRDLRPGTPQWNQCESEVINSMEANRGYCPDQVLCDASKHWECGDNELPLGALNYIDSVLFVEISGDSQKRSVAKKAQYSAFSGPPKPNAQQRADARCLNAKYRAVQRHNHCSMVAQVSERPGEGCDQVLRRRLAQAERSGVTCPTGIAPDEYVVASHHHAQDRLDHAGIRSNVASRCAKRLARAQARHSRCEQISQWHNRFGRNMSRFRERCEQRFERRWERILNQRGASSCAGAAAAEAVIASTVEALTPTLVHELKTPWLTGQTP